MAAAREMIAMFGAFCGFVTLFLLAIAAFVVWAWRRNSVYGGRSVASAVSEAVVEVSAPNFEFPDILD